MPAATAPTDRAAVCVATSDLRRRSGKNRMQDNTKARTTPPARRSREEAMATFKAMARLYAEAGLGSAFRDRGFSDRTIKTLVTSGIDAPERLLFATEADLKAIPGIGKAALGEIMRYRERFLPRSD
jgi:hypothetical protein